MATLHPSAILRQRTDTERRRSMHDLVRDLSEIARVLNDKPQ